MKHFGDITKIRGWEVPAVDCITGGSPCQDLSIAGKRAGLAGERSGLFIEQMRIVREMRERDKRIGRAGIFVRPRFMVWENVPGAFSSGEPKGADFAAVIEEIVKVCEPGAAVSVCIPDKGWPKSGCYYAEDGSWSIAWRVHDAQFWGVPQRRKRIALVADFGGLSAPEVLFVRKGLHGHFDQGEPAGQEAARGTGTGADRTVCIKGNAIDRNTAQNGGWTNENVSFSLDTTDRHGVVLLNDQGGARMSMTVDVAGALRAQEHGHQPIVAGSKWHQGAGAGNIGYENETAPTLNTEKNPAIYDARGNGNGETVPTIVGDHQAHISDYTALCIGNGQANNISMSEQANTLDTMHDQQTVYIPEVSHSLKAKGNCDFREDSETYVAFGLDSNKNGYAEQAGAIQAHTSGGCTEFVSDRTATVRRLTPIECERLQGFPDGWTDIGEWVNSKGKKRQTTDTARYKALGNSIALPFWFWLLRRISAQYERPATLGSLFDGIGGFPLCWERCNGKGTALWASEIEEFPIAVTKKWFGDN